MKVTKDFIYKRFLGSIYLLLICATAYGQGSTHTVLPAVGGPNDMWHTKGLLTSDRQFRLPGTKIVIPYYDSTGTLDYKNDTLWVHDGATWVPVVASGGSGSGTVTSITFLPPLTGNNITTTGTVSIPAASGSADGYLSSSNFTFFSNKLNKADSNVRGGYITYDYYYDNLTPPFDTTYVYDSIGLVAEIAAAKQDSLTLTTTGKGPATLVGATLNIPSQDSTTVTAGSNITVTGSFPNYTVSNPAPDQTVTLTAGPGISVSGSYPNFTVTNSSPSSGGTITALTGDVTAAGSGTVTATIATVNATPGTVGSSTAIATITTNAKGQVTGVSSNAVIAPAGTLTGTTLASNVVSSSLTAVGTISTGTWQGSSIGTPYTDAKVASINIANANGFTGATSGTSTITVTLTNTVNGLIKGNGTAMSAAVAGTDYTTPTGTESLSNKRWIPRPVTATSYTTSVTINADVTDVLEITAQSGPLLFNTPSGTPVNYQVLEIDIKDNGTPSTLTFSSGFDWSPPSTTVASKNMIMYFQYSTTDSKWRYMGKRDKP